MIAIDNILISDEIVSEQFVCDLNKCKGGCCEDGDSGAPLAKEELEHLRQIVEIVKPYLTAEGVQVLEKEGLYKYDPEFGWVTPTIAGKMCAYGFRDQQGIIKCGIEQAYLDKKITWKKPISCHLYPIKISKHKEYTNVNYEPRDVLCKPACALGKKLKLPVYQFLKEAIIRKFGTVFYTTLHQIAVEHFEEEKSRK